MKRHAVPDPELLGVLPAAALDERVAIVGTLGSGKTYAAKGWVERLMSASARCDSYRAAGWLGGMIQVSGK